MSAFASPTPATRERHDLSLANGYGEVIASEQEVPANDFHAALRRFYNLAMERATSVVVLDGVTQTRNSFLEFVREFQASTERAQPGRA